MTRALRLRKGKKPARILAGHLWAYRSELSGFEGAAPGEIADLHDASGKFLGRGYVNPKSEITFRLLSRKQEEIDAAFFRRRLAAARALREKENLLGEPARLVFSEGDLLPGFTVDQYGGTLVVALGTAGAEALREVFLEALAEVFPSEAIFERSDIPSRKREGLPLRTGSLRGAPQSPSEIRFDGIPVRVDFAQGQKTGAFLDAREMRRHLRARASGARVLDVFAHIGLFSRYARAGGAGKITAVETDAGAAAEIRSGLPDAEVIEKNAFEVLRRFERARERFDRIVLDPPPFTKDARSIDSAARGYKEINLRALRLLTPGGLLYTSSCSFHVSREAFLEILRGAAADAPRDVRVAASFEAAPDHPILLGVPETNYFKGVVLEALPG